MAWRCDRGVACLRRWPGLRGAWRGAMSNSTFSNHLLSEVSPVPGSECSDSLPFNVVRISFLDPLFAGPGGCRAFTFETTAAQPRTCAWTDQLLASGNTEMVSPCRYVPLMGANHAFEEATDDVHLGYFGPIKTWLPLDQGRIVRALDAGKAAIGCVYQNNVRLK